MMASKKSSEKLKREMIITPAYDKRNDDPKKDWGIGSCRIFFAVIGKKGAVTVNFFTNWFLPSTIKEYKEEGIFRRTLDSDMLREQFKTKIDLEADRPSISAGSWDYHSKKPTYEGQLPTTGCNWLDKSKCYGDGSCMRAERYLIILLEKGSNGIFEQLEIDYKEEF